MKIRENGKSIKREGDGEKMENYLLKHSQELSEKYPGKYVAIVEDKLVVVNNSAVNAFKIAKEKCTLK